MLLTGPRQQSSSLSSRKHHFRVEKRGGKRTRGTVQKHTTVFIHPSAAHGVETKTNHSQQIFRDGKKGDDSDSEFTADGT